jgi:hypothetical protein
VARVLRQGSGSGSGRDQGRFPEAESALKKYLKNPLTKAKKSDNLTT